MKLITRTGQLLCAGIVALSLQGCKVESIIDGTVSNGQPNPNTTLAWSEGSAFTSDGRFFVIGGNQPFTYGPAGIVVNGVSSIYEVKKSAGGKYTNVSIVDGNVNGQACYFGGLTAVRYTLYATCTNLSGPMPASVLYRVDTRKAASDPTRVMKAALSTPAFQPNGIAVDASGDLYIPNTQAFAATAIYGIPNVPAIVKVKITDHAAFKIMESGWLPALFGGYAPNGAAIYGNQLYMPSLNVIYRIPILPGGSAGTPSVVYQADKNNLFDAVTAISSTLIAVPEITNPNPEIVQIVYPGTPAPTTLITHVILIDVTTGKKVGTAPFPSHARPSSVTVAKGTLFPLNTAIVTDAIGAGGLYLIRQ